MIEDDEVPAVAENEAAATEPELPLPETPQEPISEPEPKREPWWEARIRQKTAQQRAAEERAEKAERELEVLRAASQPRPAEGAPEPRPEPAAKPPATDYDAEVERRIADREYQKNVADWLKAGRSDAADFDEKSSVLATLGGAEKPEFVQMLVSLPNGHKLVPMLAEQPEEAMRILAMPPIRMAAELGRLAAKLDDPKPRVSSSRAPKPVAPIDGHARAPEPDLNDTSLSMSEWVKLRNKTAPVHLGGVRKA